MADDKNLLEKVKELIFTDEVEETFLDVKTSDGVVLRVSEVKEGETVTIISEDGENVSGAAEYILEDGSTVVVDESGVITSVEEAAEEVEEVVEEEEMAEEEVVEEVVEANPLEDKVAKLEESIEKILAQFEKVNEQVEKFAALPADEEVKIEKKLPTAFKKSDALEGLSKHRNKKNK